MRVKFKVRVSNMVRVRLHFGFILDLALGIYSPKPDRYTSVCSVKKDQTVFCVKLCILNCKSDTW